MLYYNPTLDRDCPSWVYLSWAIGLFLYQTFDAVDGMQAYVSLIIRRGGVLILVGCSRRTRQSGPLGELFDHGICSSLELWTSGNLTRVGVDACNTVLGVFIFAATMNLGQSWATVLTLWGGMLLLQALLMKAC